MTPTERLAGASRASLYQEPQDEPRAVPLSPRAHATVEPATTPPDLDPDDPRSLIEAGATRRALATWGMRGWMNTATGGLARLAPAEDEAAHLGRIASIRAARWPRAVRVLVANKTGGVGKTATTLALGGTLATIRGGSVAAIEVSDAAGALGKRAEGQPDGLWSLMREASSINGSGHLARHMTPQSSSLDVAGSYRPRPRLGAEQIEATVPVLDEFYRIILMDSGNDPSSAAWSAALQYADVLVIPTTLSSVSIIDAMDVLDEVAVRGDHGRDLAARAVLLVNNKEMMIADNAAKRSRRQIDRVSDANPGITVVEIPAEPHFAHEGEISGESLSRDSVVAWTQAAQAVVTSIQI